ncbi:MAG: nitric oxide synthase oxygenase [Pseudonocardia sp.]|uniref:nitric oxide synthase oxygenase n=1 Tax=unclassified Pseudonocardia TaxID=2619320 RepID=UPI001ACB8B4C|nr:MULTISPECIES: nitric oxide synthase oxygenase [unclassified Pseudonocardia]MBN9109675.1 nitric oxide synthase oxygenase [Pseudonocardia sp.]
MTGRGRPDAGAPDPGPQPVDPDEAVEFLELVDAEDAAGPDAEPLAQRRAAVLDEIEATGTYRHTGAELAFGARVAWRNSARCIGRLYWKTLQVRDRRHLTAPADVAAECVAHLRDATRGGRIRSSITVFAPDVPERPGPRIHNEQLIRYAGHRSPDGTVRGDPRLADFTDLVEKLGWRRPEPRGRFDVLPLLVSGPDGRPHLYDLPDDAVLEVPLTHPEFDWFTDLRLRWHAVPAISNMPLVIGGVRYPAAPFNGWYLNTEIGARNLADADRYDLLPAIASRMGLDTSSVRTLWRDRALVELTLAVQHSFDEAGVTMADHHTESDRFLTHLAKEEKAGRSCPADWTWIVPPLSGGLTSVFHRYYDDPRPEQRPAFLPPAPDAL